MGKIFIGNIRGPKGNKGDRGSNWKEGTAITGTSTTDTAFPNSGITDAMVDDQYLNTDTGNLYTCTVAGDPNTAMWVYTGNIKGPKGDVEDGVIDFSESDDRENIVSGDTVSTVFGKIKKWFSDLGNAAFMNVVNGVTQSEAGQAVLDAAVGKYLEEKKMDISKIIANRNITEPGFVMDGKTLVDWLTELNGNMILIPTQNRLDSTVGSIATEQNVSELKTYITTVYPKNDSTGDYVMNGGSYTLIGMEYDNHQFGYQIAFGSDTKYRKLVSGNWGDWHSFVQKSDFSIESIPVNTGLICYKFGKIVMANITKEITLVVGWNTLSTAVPETINRTFGVCGTSDGVTFGMISVSGTTLQVEFPNDTAGKTITVRGSIVYFTK